MEKIKKRVIEFQGVSGEFPVGCEKGDPFLKDILEFNEEINA